MNVFNKVTLQSLKKNRTRTIVTIIGIILSASMICAVTTFTASMQDYLIRTAIYSDGSWHGSAVNADYAVYEDISSSHKVEGAVYMQQLGHAYAEGCINEFKPYIYVVGASEGIRDMLPIHISSGDYPASPDEILLPNHLAANGGVRYEIGDTLTLELGSRVLDGFVINPQSPRYVYEEGEEVLTAETLEIKESRTYRVVGFYNRLPGRIEDYSSPGYTAITAADKEASADDSYDVYFQMKNPKDVYDFMEEHGYTGNKNTDVLMYQGVSRYDSFTTVLMGLAAIVIGLIMFGSISLIYNAFSISVSERTRQFGLLSSIGATKKQLRRMVFFEAFVVGLIGIPIGILSGIAGIGITLMLLGNRFTALTGIENVAMRICVSWEAVVIAAVVALVTVLISAWIPSRRATRISAVEAIRQNTDIKGSSKPVKTSKLTYQLFGLPGMLASKHYKRSKRKYRTTVMSLFMSIVLFVSASAFTDYLMESIGGHLGTNGFDLWYAGGEGDFGGKTPHEMLAMFQSGQHVDKVTYDNAVDVGGCISEEYLNQGILDSVLNRAPSAPEGFDGETYGGAYGSVIAYVHFIPDEEFLALLKQYDLSEKEYLDPENPLAITIDSTLAFDRSQQKYTTTNLLSSDRYELLASGQGEEDAYVTYTLKSGKTIHEYPYYIRKDSGFQLQILYPARMYKEVIPEELRAENKYYFFYMTSTDHAASYESLETVLNENGLSADSLYDYAGGVEQERNMLMIIQVFSYGFIVLISLIAAANVFNTISTNISLRRREFAMLKSVGMTEKGFNRMMNFECLLYGSRALLLGLPVSGGVTYLIYLAILEGYETTFHLPWKAIGIAVLSVFLVVFATMMYAMNKVRKDNPIDALKNENL